jgi:hypothetical protein
MLFINAISTHVTALLSTRRVIISRRHSLETKAASLQQVQANRANATTPSKSPSRPHQGTLQAPV